MVYEWVGTAATAVVGVVGIVGTWLSSKQGRDSTERLAREGFEHEHRLAREARQQQRLADSYVKLLGMVERTGQWAQMVKPIMDTIPPQPLRPLPELDEQAEVEAFVNAFGSDDVRAALEAWRGIVRDVIAAVGLIDLEAQDVQRARPSSVDYGSPYMKLHELRPVERRARETLARQVSRELRESAAL